MRTITINVTKRDIKNGKAGAGSCSKCPIALAVKRINKNWCVGAATIFSRRNSLWVALLPRSARTFIDRFDSRERVRPFSFKLRIP